MLGVLYAVTLAYSYTCYSDLDTDESRRIHCMNAGHWGNPDDFKSIDKFEPVGKTCDDAIVVLSQSRKIDYDHWSELAEYEDGGWCGCGVYVYARPPPVADGAKVLESRLDDIVLTLETSMTQQRTRQSADMSFNGFSKLIIKNTANLAKNTLFIDRLPCEVSQIRTLFESSDERPIHIVCRNGVSFMTLAEYESDIWDVLTAQVWQISLPTLESINGRTFNLKDTVSYYLHSDTTSVSVVLSNTGMKVSDGNYWFKIEGSMQSLGGSDAVLTCEDGFTSASYVSYSILSSFEEVTIQGTNWPEKIPQSLYVSSSTIKLECNACPFSLSTSSMILTTQNMYIEGMSFSRNMQITGIDGLQTSVLRIGAMEVHHTGYQIQLGDGISLQIETVVVQNRLNIAPYLQEWKSQAITVEKVELEYGTCDPIVPGITISMECEIQARMDVSLEELIPEGVFQDVQSRAALRRDLKTVVNHIHEKLPNTAKSISFVNGVDKVSVSSWTAGEKYKLALKPGDVMPCALAYVDEFVIVQSEDPNKEFTKDDWEVSFVNGPYFEGAIDDVIEFSQSTATGEAVYGKGQLKYRYTSIPDSAVDFIIYTDEKWANTLSGFAKYVRILTSKDLNGMDKRINSKAKNVVLCVMEDVPTGSQIDLSGIRSDANVVVVGFPLQKILDVIDTDDTLFDEVMEVMAEMDMQKIVALASKYLPSWMPTVRINLGTVQTLVTCWVNYVSSVTCTNIAGVVSKFSVASTLKYDYAYFDMSTYSYTKGKSCKSLTIIPFDINSGALYSLNKVEFSASGWDLHYSCSSQLPSGYDMLCSSGKAPVSHTISASRVTEDLRIFSLFSNSIEYNHKSDAKVHGIKIYAGADIEEDFLSFLPSIPLLEDAKSVKKENLVGKVKRMLAKAIPTENSDVALTFTGSWDKVTEITRMLYVMSCGATVSVANPVKVVAEALSFESLDKVTISGVSTVKFANPQYITRKTTYALPGATSVEFAELCGVGNKLAWQRPTAFPVIENVDQIVVDKITCKDSASMTIPKATVKKAISLSPESLLSISEGTLDNCDLEFNYRLAVDSPWFSSPAFTPKSIKIAYAGDSRNMVINDYINTRRVLRSFATEAECSTWKDLATLKAEENTRNGEVFTVGLECVASGAVFNLQLAFALSDKTVDPEPEVPPPSTGGSGDATEKPPVKEEIVVPVLPDEVFETMEFPAGESVTITVESDGSGSASSTVTFTETTVDSSTKVTVEATLVLTKSLVMTGDSAIIAGSGGAIEFEATCEVQVVASGTSLPMIDIGTQKANAAVPKSLTVTLDLQAVSEDEIKETFGDGKVLLSGYNLDCDKWIAAIKLDVTSEFKFAVKCREASSGKLLAVKNEIYVVLDTLSGGAIAGIVIGCIVAAAAIGFAVWFFLFRNKPNDSTDQENVVEA